MTFADLLLDLAKSLAGFLSASANLRRARSQGIGDLLERMADCLAGIADKLEQGQEPVAECHELLHYSQVVPKALRKAAGFWNRKSARNLGERLLVAVEVPSRAVFNLQKRQSAVHIVLAEKELASPPSVGDELRKPREASGLFTAAAHVVRSGSGL